MVNFPPKIPNECMDQTVRTNLPYDEKLCNNIKNYPLDANASNYVTLRTHMHAQDAGQVVNVLAWWSPRLGFSSHQQFNLFSHLVGVTRTCYPFTVFATVNIWGTVPENVPSAHAITKYAFSTSVASQHRFDQQEKKKKRETQNLPIGPLAVVPPSRAEPQFPPTGHTGTTPTDL